MCIWLAYTIRRSKKLFLEAMGSRLMLGMPKYVELLEFFFSIRSRSRKKYSGFPHTSLHQIESLSFLLVRFIEVEITRKNPLKTNITIIYSLTKQLEVVIPEKQKIT